MQRVSDSSKFLARKADADLIAQTNATTVPKYTPDSASAVVSLQYMVRSIFSRLKRNKDIQFILKATHKAAPSRRVLSTLMAARAGTNIRRENDVGYLTDIKFMLTSL